LLIADDTDVTLMTMFDNHIDNGFLEDVPLLCVPTDGFSALFFSRRCCF
jgi:hypothetical protein